MKKTIFLALALVGIANANQNLPAKVVTLPFDNQPIVSENYQGLYFDYDMQNQKKIVCQYQNVYKLWTEYKDNGQSVELGVFSGSGDFTMTNKGKTDEGKNQWHADAKGSAKIMSWLNNEPNQTASCHYELDGNQ